MKLEKLCDAFKKRNIAVGIMDTIVVNGDVSEWVHKHYVVARLLDYGAPNCFRILRILAWMMFRSRINYILNNCFNTGITFHVKYDEFQGKPLYGYFKIGSRTYETSLIDVCLDENYNVVDVIVDESTRVIYAMNDGKVKYLVKLAKQLYGKLEELKKMLELIPSGKRDYDILFYLRAVDFIEKTCLINHKLCNYDDYESVKRELKKLLDETNTILKNVKKYYAEKTLFPE